MLEMLSELTFDRGDTVFHVTAQERCPGLVVGINVWPDSVTYEVIWPDRRQERAYPCELSREWAPRPAVELKDGEAV